ncbi:cytochrome b N-terminal domain-containing protein [Verrucomicrobia bacterium]|nr:cytochrome b N-terminal domain-containing protein [Verrucomicrobiota bacterium]
MRRLLKWIDDRTGLEKVIRSALFNEIPGGAKWRHTWGGILLFMFAVQAITGMALWMSYSPSTRSAWESVYYIQHVMQLGWLVRGIHYYAAEAMVIMVLLHVFQKIWFKGYRKPRELMFWIAMAMALVVISFSLTGYLLPWDQQGYWSAKVRTHIMSLSPVFGTYLERLTVGGEHFGHHTLTRFFALHAGVLPVVFSGLLLARMMLVRRYRKQAFKGIARTEINVSSFWPGQALKNAIACLAVMGLVTLMTLKPQWFGFTHIGMGAPLAAPADPTDLYAAARPEWYFLFLFQFLKYFPGEKEVLGAIFIPSLIVGYFVIMPWVAKLRIGHYFNILVSMGLLTGAFWLTYSAKMEDATNANYIAAGEQAHEKAQRAVELASGPTGIPEEGALHLLHHDPKTLGPRLFAAHCSSCHRFGGHDGTGNVPLDTSSAPDLKDFASRAWLTDLLKPEHIATKRYFGETAFRNGDMVRFVNKKVSQFDKEEKLALERAIKALSAEAGLSRQAEVEEVEADLIVLGKEDLGYELGCSDCHAFHFEDDDADGPDLTGYGSREWMKSFISDPGQKRFYGENNDRMPSFLTEGILTPTEIGLLVDWLRQDWFEPLPK